MAINCSVRGKLQHFIRSPINFKSSNYSLSVQHCVHKLFSCNTCFSGFLSRDKVEPVKPASDPGITVQVPKDRYIDLMEVNHNTAIRFKLIRTYRNNLTEPATIAHRHSTVLLSIGSRPLVIHNSTTSTSVDARQVVLWPVMVPILVRMR